MEHPPTSSALEDSARKFRLALAAVIDWSFTGLDPHLVKALEATAAELIANARSVPADRDALDTARKDRASIVAFLGSEADRFEDAIAFAVTTTGPLPNVGKVARLQVQASLLRTLAAQIKRGDDRQGFDAPADSDRAPVRDLLSAAVAFRDAEAAWNAATPEDGEWATVEVVESAADKQRTALESLRAAATRAASLMVDRARFGAAADREVER